MEDEIQDLFVIDTLEQLRAIADPLRQRILDIALTQRHTSTQIAEILGESAAKVHYHVRELERVGLVRLVETRERGGILEKYYRAVARAITVSPSLIQSMPKDEAFTMLQGFLDGINADSKRAFARQLEVGHRQSQFRLTKERLYLNDAELDAFSEALHALFERFDHRVPDTDQQEYTLSLIFHPAADHTPPPADVPAPASPRTADAPRRIFVIGAYHLDRQTLEEALTQHQQLRITVFGICSIARAIPADLYEATVERLTVFGTLSASPEIAALVAQQRP